MALKPETQVRGGGMAGEAAAQESERQPGRAGAGAGARAAEAAIEEGASVPRLQALLMEHPDELEAIVALVHQRLGNSFVEEMFAASAAQGSEPAGAVQMKATGGAGLAGGQARETAEAGFAAPGGAYPFQRQIEASFGRPIGATAHVGGAAADACGALGAEAYAAAGRVAFAGPPSLHTAAHEAAHIVQQAGGVQLKAGVGQRGDGYERAADEAADAVVAGRSAAHVLGDAPAGASAGAGNSGVQLKETGVPAGHTLPDEKHYARARRWMEIHKKKIDKNLPPPAKRVRLDKDGDGLADHIIKSGVDRAKTFAKLGIVETAEVYDRQTAEEQFLEDLESGIEHYQKSMGYIDKVISYWKRTGKWQDLGPVLGEVSKIAKTIKGHLGKVKQVVEGIHNVVSLVDALDQFVDDWRDPDPSKWTGGARKVMQASEPFITWLGGKGLQAAARGSRIAGQATVAFGYVSSMLNGALTMAHKGVRVMKDAIEMKTRDLEEIEANKVGAPRQQAEERPPSAPGRWDTVAEKHDVARMRDNANLLAATDARKMADAKQAIVRFNQFKLPAIYLKHRARMIRQVRELLRKGAGRTPWWDFFTATDAAPPATREWKRAAGDGSDAPDLPYWDERAGIQIVPRKTDVGPAEAWQEAENFLGLPPNSCPPWESWYTPALNAFIDDEINRPSGEPDPYTEGSLKSGFGK